MKMHRQRAMNRCRLSSEGRLDLHFAEDEIEIDWTKLGSIHLKAMSEEIC